MTVYYGAKSPTASVLQPASTWPAGLFKSDLPLILEVSAEEVDASHTPRAATRLSLLGDALAFALDLDFPGGAIPPLDACRSAAPLADRTHGLASGGVTTTRQLYGFTDAVVIPRIIVVKTILAPADSVVFNHIVHVIRRNHDQTVSTRLGLPPLMPRSRKC